MFSRYKSFKSEKIKERCIEVGDDDDNEVPHPGVVIPKEDQVMNNLNPQPINNLPLTSTTTQKLDSFAALAMRKKQSPSNLYSNTCPNITRATNTQIYTVQDDTRTRSNSSLPVVEHKAKPEPKPVLEVATAKDNPKEETRRRAFSLQFFKKKNVDEAEEKKIEKNEKKFDIKKNEEFSFDDFYVRDKNNKLH